jgi:hypothetical protein
MERIPKVRDAAKLSISQEAGANPADDADISTSSED